MGAEKQTTEQKAAAAMEELGSAPTDLAPVPTGKLIPYDPSTSPAGDGIERGNIIPIMRVFQASKKEEAKFNPIGTPDGATLKYGDVFIGSTGERIMAHDKSRSFIVVNRVPRFVLVVWPKERGEGPPEATYEIDTTKPIAGQVPEEFLKPGGKVGSFDMEDGRSVRLGWCYVALFEPANSSEKWIDAKPVLLVFAWTTQGCGTVIESTEADRASSGKTGAMWRLTTADKKNDSGEWKTPRVAMAGDAPPEAAEAAKNFGSRKAKAVEIEW